MQTFVSDSQFENKISDIYLINMFAVICSQLLDTSLQLFPFLLRDHIHVGKP